MRTILAAALIVFLAASASAYDLGNSAPLKSESEISRDVPPRLQGGDTLAEAVLVPDLPFAATGTTVGYANDYDEPCPYVTSTAPDVVYKLQVPVATFVDVDLCGSGYNTKAYIYREDFTVVACDDDYYNLVGPCGNRVSKLIHVPLDGTVKYYLVIDGGGAAAGDYELHIEEVGPCDLTCQFDWPYAVVEGEPPLVDDYVDYYDGGCNTPGYPFQEVYAYTSGLTLCGGSGWYGSYTILRDTDWYRLYMGAEGTIEVTVAAELPTYCFELLPQDCADTAVRQMIEVGPCDEAHMTITGYGDWEPVWFWVGPTTFVPPEGGDNVYEYVLYFEGLAVSWSADPAASERASWGAVKSLFR